MCDVEKEYPGLVSLELQGRITERAEKTENLGSVPKESIQELQEIGFLRLLHPEAFGGGQADPVTFFSGVRDLSAVCGATGWVASLLGVHAWHLALFPIQAQEEVWGEDQSTLLCSSYAPTGDITRVDGGYMVTGRWSFSSGCEHARWALLGGTIMQDGHPVDLATFLLPLGDYEIDPVWDVVGLRGTGSHDVVVPNAFVPDHRVLSFRHTAVCRTPGQELNKSPLYRIPWGSLFPYAVTTPLIGMATGAYRANVEHTRSRVRAVDRELSTGKGKKAGEDPDIQLAVAESACDLDASWLQLERNFGHLMRMAEERTPIQTGLRTAVRRDQASAARRSVLAVDRLFANAGGRALKNGTPLQRLWRDVHAGNAHAYNDYGRIMRLFSRSEFGLSVQDPIL